MSAESCADKVVSGIFEIGSRVTGIVGDAAKGIKNARGILRAAEKSGATSALRGSNIPKVGKALKRGKEAHDKWNPGSDYVLNRPLPSGKRPDAVNWKTREVVELKPNNPRAIKRGWRQVEGYLRELERMTGKKWTSRVETYD